MTSFCLLQPFVKSSVKAKSSVIYLTNIYVPKVSKIIAAYFLNSLQSLLQVPIFIFLRNKQWKNVLSMINYPYILYCDGEDNAFLCVCMPIKLEQKNGVGIWMPRHELSLSLVMTRQQHHPDLDWLHLITRGWYSTVYYIDLIKYIPYKRHFL